MTSGAGKSSLPKHSVKTVKALTYEQQLALLARRGLEIGEPEMALNRLRQVNYARLKGYLLPFKTQRGNYIPGVTFERVYHLYVFDSRLRGLLFPILAEVELTLRSALSYDHAHWYGSFGYLDPANFAKAAEHRRFLRNLQIAVDDRDNKPFLSGHRKTNGQYPVWVILELLSMGSLSSFFANLPAYRQDAFARKHFGLSGEVLEDWMRCFTRLRNVNAHYCRLYYAPFPVTPATLPDPTLFSHLLVVRSLYLHPNRWNTGFLPALAALLGEYAADLNMTDIGFPPDWQAQLRK